VRRVLIIEDDVGLQQELRSRLAGEGYEVDVAHDEAGGLEKALTWQPDIVVLDLGSGVAGDFGVCKEITGRALAPVIILSARSSPADKIRGFELGADDYLTKPFVMEELLARVRVVLRRTRRETAAADAVRFDDVVVDLEKGVVMRGGVPVAFAHKEFELLRFLVSHPGRAFTRDELLRTVWGFREAPLSRTVDTHIARLRQKLEVNPHDPRHIQTMYGTGYAFIP
jgi:two-component system alkaline phosphatase synthesis response regulator PhoP